MTRVLLSISCVFTVLFLNAQTQMSLPVTFDDPTVEYGLVGFGGADASTIEMDPTNASNMVAKVIKAGFAELWAGTTVTNANGDGFSSAIPFSSNLTTMTVRVWSPTSGIPVRLKAEDSTNPTISVETEATTTAAGEWQVLTFDFNNQATGTAAINFSNTYNKVSIFFNFGTPGSVAGEQTYYFDDIMMGEPTGGPAQMNLPVTFEEDNVEYGLAGFGGAEASTIEADPTDANNTVAKVIKSGNAELWAGTTITNAAQQGFASAIPFTADNTTMTVRVWSPDAGIPVRLKVEDSSNNTISVETEASTTVAGEWETLTFDFSNQATGTAAINLANNYNKASIFFNFGTPGSVAGEKTYYFDDIQMGSGGGGAQEFNITFRVDMSAYTEAFVLPEVNGSFNDWCGGCAPLSDADGDDIWEITIPLEAGTYEYKFAHDAWAGQETLIPGSPCTVTNFGFTNRSLEVSADAVLDVVCWGACESCENISGPYNVTFKVDMSQYTGTYTTPEVNGSFNGWCGGCAQMTDADGDDVWEITIPLNGGTYEYKFAHDAWAGQEELTPGSSCTTTIDGFTNRSITVEGETSLDVVCWASCAACIVSVEENFASNLSVYPNPANEQIAIAGFNNTSNAQVMLFDLSGKLIYNQSHSGNGTAILSTEAFADGIYTLRIVSDGNAYHSSIVIRH